MKRITALPNNLEILCMMYNLYILSQLLSQKTWHSICSNTKLDVNILTANVHRVRGIIKIAYQKHDPASQFPFGAKLQFLHLMMREVFTNWAFLQLLLVLIFHL